MPTRGSRGKEHVGGFVDTASETYGTTTKTCNMFDQCRSCTGLWLTLSFASQVLHKGRDLALLSSRPHDKRDSHGGGGNLLLSCRCCVVSCRVCVLLLRLVHTLWPSALEPVASCIRVPCQNHTLLLVMKLS